MKLQRYLKKTPPRNLLVASDDSFPTNWGFCSSFWNQNHLSGGPFENVTSVVFHDSERSGLREMLFFSFKLITLNGLKWSSSWWFQPIWKIMSEIGSFPQIGMKIKKNWNHHLVITWQFCEKTVSFFWGPGEWKRDGKNSMVFQTRPPTIRDKKGHEWNHRRYWWTVASEVEQQKSHFFRTVTTFQIRIPKRKRWVFLQSSNINKKNASIK